MAPSLITIRPLQAADIPQVVIIHAESFPTSRSTRLGSPFLKKMYQWYFAYQPALSFVATYKDEMVGFVTGAYGGGTARRRFRYAFWQIVGGFLRRPHLFLKKEMFEGWAGHLRGLLFPTTSRPVSNPNMPSGNKVTLDSIAVRPQARGQDVGKALVDTFEHAARQTGATYLGLGVESDNTRARRFYERCGWQLVRDDVQQNSANYVKRF